MQQFDHIFHLVGQKYYYNLEKDPTRATHVPYMSKLQYDSILLEEEITANNVWPLEEILWSMLRDYCNLVYTLQKEGYIDSVYNVLEKTLETYERRVSQTDEEKSTDSLSRLQRQRLFH